MEDSEIRKIHLRLDGLEHRIFENDQKRDSQIQALAKSNEEIMEILIPMSQVFTNAQGFRKVSVVMLKSIILVGSAVAVMYGVIRWLKN